MKRKGSSNTLLVLVQLLIENTVGVSTEVLQKIKIELPYYSLLSIYIKVSQGAWGCNSEAECLLST